MDKSKKKSNILETARKRIIDFIESQDIKPKDFLAKTGLAKGFVDRSHQLSGASDVNLSKILDAYPELSPLWLLTGKGDMLVTDEPINVDYLREYQSSYNSPSASINISATMEALHQTIQAQQKTIESQEKTIASLEKLLAERSRPDQGKGDQHTSIGTI